MMDAYAGATKESFASLRSYAQEVQSVVAARRPDWQRLYAATAAPAGGWPRQVEFEVLSTNRFIKESKENLTFAAALPEGGFLAASRIRGGAVFVYKVSNSGSVIWRTPVAEHGSIYSGGIKKNGSYWVGGSLGNPDSDAVQIISRDGAPTEQHALARAEERRFLSCAVEHDDDYMQIGSVQLNNYRRIFVSAISRTSSAGARLWEHLTPFDQGRRIAPIPQQLFKCAGIFLTGDGHVLTAQQILVWPETHSDDEIEQVWNHGGQLRLATLVLAYDLAGHEIARLRDNDTKAGLLIPASQGAVLLESSYLKPGLNPVAPEDDYVHVRWINSTLQNIGDPLVIADGQFDVVDAAYLTPRGGLLLAGCSGTTSRIFVRYISSDRAVSPKKELPQLGNCGGDYWFTKGPHPNEALLLSEAAPGLGSFVTTLRFPE